MKLMVFATLFCISRKNIFTCESC